ncbi:MAG: hypothetical protein CMM59_18025 [Rhodospirillaceae bacterium]|nr:hypothetical protein [Rhodospirillaceae bacterium]|tara:strand:- start:69 stop:266 length:198 start_codon:yes stop_codon:yes gene_type:complete
MDPANLELVQDKREWHFTFEPATSADEGLVIVSRVAAKGFSDVAQLKSALREGRIKGKRLVLRER